MGDPIEAATATHVHIPSAEYRRLLDLERDFTLAIVAMMRAARTSRARFDDEHMRGCVGWVARVGPGPGGVGAEVSVAPAELRDRIIRV